MCSCKSLSRTRNIFFVSSTNSPFKTGRHSNRCEHFWIWFQSLGTICVSDTMWWNCGAAAVSILNAINANIPCVLYMNSPLALDAMYIYTEQRAALNNCMYSMKPDQFVTVTLARELRNGKSWWKIQLH